MVQAIDFAIRDFAGAKQHGSVAGDTQGNFIPVGAGDSISLNLTKSSIVTYEQQGGDLIIKLSDGRLIVLSNYFNEVPGQENHLYLSADGEMTEVLVHSGSDGVLFADYGPVSGWDKWSPLDDLRFTTADNVADAIMVSNEPAGMAEFIPGRLGGFGGAGAAAAAVGGIDDTPMIVQPNPFSQGETIVVPKSTVGIQNAPGTGLAEVQGGTNLPEVVAGLNALGVAPHDMIDILKSIKAAGALHAEFVVN